MFKTFSECKLAFCQLLHTPETWGKQLRFKTSAKLHIEKCLYKGGCEGFHGERAGLLPLYPDLALMNIQQIRQLFPCTRTPSQAVCVLDKVSFYCQNLLLSATLGS